MNPDDYKMINVFSLDTYILIMSDKDEIDKIRERKKEEMKRQAEQPSQEEIERQQEEAEQKKEALLKQNLSEEARRRLNTVQMAKPEFGEKVEQQIIALIQSGRVQEEIDESTMKKILEEMSEEESDDYDIRGMSSRK
jgi:programmed cell death protein 5